MMGLRASIDIEPRKTEVKASVPEEPFKMLTMMKQVLKSNNTIIKKLDTIEATQTRLEADIKALKPSAPAYAASSNSAEFTNTRPLSAAPKDKHPGAASCASPVPHSATSPTPVHRHSPSSSSRSDTSPPTKTPVTKIHKASPSSWVPKPANEATPSPEADKKARLTPEEQTQWLDALEVCIQSATHKREAKYKFTTSSEISTRAERFLRWYFPRHGVDRYTIEEKKVVVSDQGTLDEEWAWDLQMKLGGKVVWKKTTTYRYVDQTNAIADLARGVIALDPQGWKDWAAKENQQI
ncbi:hypothetical protein IAT38_004133 [Cryptococcus sp. DSM 104549]